MEQCEHWSVATASGEYSLIIFFAGFDETVERLSVVGFADQSLLRTERETPLKAKEEGRKRERERELR